ALFFVSSRRRHTSWPRDWSSDVCSSDLPFHHALEALQCMVERRTRGEQGVRRVRCLEGEAVWKAGDAGEWSWELLEHALGRSPSLNVGDVRRNCRHFVPPAGRPTYLRGPLACQVEYRDGLRATALILNGHTDDTTF